jgi:hypothetical protein
MTTLYIENELQSTRPKYSKKYAEAVPKVDEPILVGRLNRRPTFEPKMVMKETESCLLQNLKSQLWAIGCVEIFSS